MKVNIYLQNMSCGLARFDQIKVYLYCFLCAACLPTSLIMHVPISELHAQWHWCLHFSMSLNSQCFLQFHPTVMLGEAPVENQISSAFTNFISYICIKHTVVPWYEHESNFSDDRYGTIVAKKDLVVVYSRMWTGLYITTLHLQSFWNSSDLGGRKSWGLPITSVMPVPMSTKHFWMMCLLF